MRHHRHRHGRWLHARISEPLEEALKDEARRRQLPVSLLVRNVLAGALDLVEDIVETGLGTPARPSRRGADLDDVYGWQELILNRGALCATCRTPLAAGASAYRGLRDQPGPAVFLCTACVRQLRRPSTAKEEESS